MLYPQNFETKIGFTEVRNLMHSGCISTLGTEMVDKMEFSTDISQIREWMCQVREFRLLLQEREDFPLSDYFDMRRAVSRIRMENTHLEEEELFNLRRSLDTLHRIKQILVPEQFELGTPQKYPHLQMLAEEVSTFPYLIHRIDQILDKFGHIRDTASPELARIRRELKQAEGSVSRTLYAILRQAQQEGLVERDASPALRDGRLVIPVSPALKRKIPGIVHDESATGKTAFVEPTQVVEANNKIRELENAEKKELIKILTEFAKVMRPDVKYILASFKLLANMDFIQTKLKLSIVLKAIEPEVNDEPMMDWVQARHPLLQLSLQKQDRKVVPLDIQLNKEGRLLIISGPNAGGKSVCLKTTGLLQYMLQCGLPVPMKENSTCGVFNDIMIDIGDEQSIENDLSTYSSHLQNMKQMMKAASPNTLILIDEFGTGTEPQIGGAIAESVLRQFWKKGAYGVITTHYQNLKHFADEHEGVANGAMLYDRHEMQALYQLQIGRPGSSFAIEIARKTGIPEEVIADATEIVGQDYIQADKYLQDIVRDKRYWENKRQTIHQREKDMQRTIDKYEDHITDLEAERKAILRKAKEQAQEMLREANKRIEQVIKEIREAQAEKEFTREIRRQLVESFGETPAEEENNKHNSSPRGGREGSSEGTLKKQLLGNMLSDEDFEKKIAEIKARKERHAQRQADKLKADQERKARVDTFAPEKLAAAKGEITVGSAVVIKGMSTVGTVEALQGKQATVIFGDVRSKIAVNKLELSDKEKKVVMPGTHKHADLNEVHVSRSTRNSIDTRRSNFHTEIDVRGLYADDALDRVMHFIDDAIMVGIKDVRILHGKGTGALRQTIREYLATVPNVIHFHDEHVQFGGSGITVVEL